MALPKRFSLIAAVLTLLLSFSALYAQENYVDIADFADENGCELRLDYWKGMYELRKGGSIARLMEGSSYYLLNFIELRSGLQAVVTDEGHFLIDKKSAGILQEFFEQTAASHRGITYIVLDPGHGGKDPGAIGYFTVDNEKKTLREKDVVLSTVLETARLLRLRFPEKTVLLTRSDDRYLKLEERTEIANSINLADDESMIFISVHANASFNSTAKGFEVWYLPPEFRRDLVDPDRMEDVDSDVIPILNTMLEEEFTIESVILGEHLLKALDLQVGDITENRGPKEESWFVVRNARMPSVLIELGFVTNPAEAALLSTDAYLKKLSNGIYNGIVEFISDYERSRGYSD